MNTHRFSKMKFTRKPSFPKNPKHTFRQLGNMYSASSTVVTTTEASSTQSSCARNGKRNNCRCCNIHYSTKNSLNNVHNIEVNDPLCTGLNKAKCHLMPDNSNICCTSWDADMNGCKDASAVCMIDTNGANLCGRQIQGCSGEDIPIWEPAYFYSGGETGFYTENDIGKNANNLSNNKPNGADSSCGGSDTVAFSECISGKSNQWNCTPSTSAKDCYNIQYTGTGSTVFGYPGICTDSAYISLVNEEKEGKVATIEHGTLGQDISGAMCTGDHYDQDMSPELFNSITATMNTIVRNCSKNKHTFLVYNDCADTIKDMCCNKIVDSPTISCLISSSLIKSYFSEYFNTKNPIQTCAKKYDENNTNDKGVAIGWGHGVLDGGCGRFTFMQQGNAKGLRPHWCPGQTTLSFQIGMRTWSGEWSDAADVTDGDIDKAAWGSRGAYLRNGSSISGNNSCLQPMVAKANTKKVINMLNEICTGIDDCTPINLPA